MKKRIGCIGFVICLAFIMGGCKMSEPKKVDAGEYVAVYETSGTKASLLARKTDLILKEADEVTPNAVITVDAQNPKQDIVGFGAALTHASGYVLMNMDPEKRTAILKDLFSPEEGVGFQMVRVPIGSSDFTCPVDGKLQHFSLDDVPAGETDPELEKFNIKTDEETIIPVLKEILEINPDITIIALPWSAPAWMKTSDHLYKGSLLEEYEDVYAEYFVKFVQAYDDYGIDIKYLSMQNEPYLGNMDYPTMIMDEYQNARMIGLVGDKLRDAGYKDIMMLGYEHNSSFMVEEMVEGFADALYEDENCAKYLAGLAFHGYENEGIEDFQNGPLYVQDTYGGKVFMTELSEGFWSMDFAANLNYSLHNVVLGGTNCGMSGVTYWNIALYEDGTPVLGGGDNCIGLITIDKETGFYTKNAAYYSLAQVSSYVQPVKGVLPKAIETESDSPSITCAGYLLGDGTVVIVALNTGDKYAEDIDVQYEGMSVTYQLQPQTVATFVF